MITERMEKRMAKYFDKELTIRISVAYLLLISLLFFTFFYVCWEIYWYTRVGLMFIKWHTHLFIYIFPALCLAVLSKLTSFKKIYLSIYIFLFIFCLIELLFVLGGQRMTAHEKKFGYYSSPYTTFYQSHYHTWNTTESEPWLKTEEFNYWRPTNSLGFADKEWKFPQETPNEKRILALGDSFTEGDGAPFDSSYVSLLAHKLNRDTDNVYIMNGGVCGSDPFENYMNLEHLLLKLKPDIVIQCISTNDLYTDVAVKGGFERFVSGGQKYKKAPWWEFIYATSYISRLFFSALGYNSLLIKENDPNLQTELNAHLRNLFYSYEALCRENNIELLVCIMPEREEFLKNRYRFNFNELLSYLYEKQIKTCDLLPHYRTKRNVKLSYESYYWKRDAHHNSLGYSLMADGIYECVFPLLQEEKEIGYRSY